MTIAERFAACLGEVSTPEVAGPELLPVRLVRACARMLPVDGVGLSLLDGTWRRTPLAATPDEAALAERLQFTVGDGPCASAQQRREPVFAAGEELRRRWPGFAELLLAQTPYRAVVALPLGDTLAGWGSLDVFFTDDRAVPRLEVFDAMAVAGLVASALSDAAIWSTWSADEGPAWMQSPAARSRSMVWTAIGRLDVALSAGAPAALDLLRAAARSTGRPVDELAADVVAGRLDPAALAARPGGDAAPGPART